MLLSFDRYSWIILLILFWRGDGFLMMTTTYPLSNVLRLTHSMRDVRLFMAKSSKSKQAALKEKLEEAKRQKQQQEQAEPPVYNCSDGAPARTNTLTEKELKERNDRLRFEELLKKKSFSSEGYLNVQQEEENIDAFRSGVDRLFEGDPAPDDCFEELVSIKSENAIGPTGKQRLVPWLQKNPQRHDDFLVVVSDPRPQSPELRESVKSILKELPVDIRNRLVIVNADSPAENRRWLKKNGITDDKLEIYSDEKLEWMRTYTALGGNRWSMTMFVLADRKVVRLARDIDQYGACQSINNAVISFQKEKRL